MKTIITIAALASSTAAFASAVPPSARDVEAKANGLVPQTELAKVRTDLETINQARRNGKSTAAEVKDTESYYKAADKALSAAIEARDSLNKAEFYRQAKIVNDNRGKACAILAGC